MQDGDMEMQMAQLLEERGASATNEDNSSVEEDNDAVEMQPAMSNIGSLASAPQPDEEAQADTSSSSAENKEAEKQEPESAIKLLVPNYVAGILIGKKGATIKEIQLKASCMVRIASSGMYFPGTTERAVLVAGDTEAVKKACGLVLHTLNNPIEAPPGDVKLLQSHEASKLEVTQRLLIPLTAGGLVIGRKGANITALLEASGAKVTLGQKSEIKANERLVTVQGDLNTATKAIVMLVDKLREEPLLSRFANLSVSYKGSSGKNTNNAAAKASVAPPVAPYQTISSPVTTPAPAAEVQLAGADADSVAAIATSAGAPAAYASPTQSSTSEHTSPMMAASPQGSWSPPTGGRAGLMGGFAGRGGGGVGMGGRQPHPQQQQFRQPTWQQNQFRHHPQHQQQQHHQHNQQQQQQQQQQQYPQQQQQQQQQHSVMGRCPPAQIGAPPGSPMSPLPPPMMPLGPGAPIMTNTSHQMGGPLGPVSLLTHPPMHPGMGIAYGGAPAGGGSVFHPAGMQFHGAPNAGVANAGGGGCLGGGDGQARGHPSMQQPQMCPMIVPFEPVTNPIAAAVAACQPMTTVTVGIPNSMIGAILGKGGATISEFQNMSGARINVSQRDEFLPGTENRVLTICGTPMATHTAQYLVSQKIQEVSERPKRQAIN